jgi:hypothetical protein
MEVGNHGFLQPGGTNIVSSSMDLAEHYILMGVSPMILGA